ncbi:MAG: hypothetical protein PVJ08_08055 [Dehalococcoidia bacterium]|jgi:hypothetical protein
MSNIGKIILVVVVGITSLSLTGCGNEPRTELTPVKKVCIEMMQQVPVYYEDFEFWDVGMLRDDPDLSDMYQVWYDRKVEFLEQNYGLQSTSVDYLGQGEGLLYIIVADYDIGTLRDRIRLDFYRDTSYEDMEVWKSEQNINGNWVLAEGLLIRGANVSNVDDYSKVSRGEELSMYDKNAAELLEKLPEGIMTRISRSSYPEGLILSGMSVDKEDQNTLRWTNVYQFESIEAAENTEVSEYFQGIEDSVAESESESAKHGESPPFRDFSLERSGKSIEWSVLLDVQYMIALLFYG